MKCTFIEHFWQNFVQNNESIRFLFVAEPRREKTCFFAYAKTKAQISCAVIAQLISAFVFASYRAFPGAGLRVPDAQNMSRTP